MIRTDGQYLIAEFLDSIFEFLQLTQLRIAVRSPTATVKDQQGPLALDPFGQVGGGAIRCMNLYRRSRSTDQKWPDFSRG